MSKSTLLKIFWLALGAAVLSAMYWFGEVVSQSLKDAGLFGIVAYFIGYFVITGVGGYCVSSKRPFIKLLSLPLAVVSFLYLIPFLSFLVRVILSFDGSGCTTGYGRYCE